MYANCTSQVKVDSRGTENPRISKAVISDEISRKFVMVINWVGV